MIGHLLLRGWMWIIWRANLRRWRRLLRACPKLARCWAAVEGTREVRPGYINASARICNIAEMRSDDTPHDNWYAARREHREKGWNEVAEIHLEYVVANSMQDIGFITLYVSTLDQRLLGARSGFMKGF